MCIREAQLDLLMYMIFMIPMMSQIQVGYKRPRTFVLTPSRKHIGKAVARQSKKTIAVESLRDPVSRNTY